MLTIIFTFLAIVVSNYYTMEHGALGWFGLTFTLGAILFTPAFIMRDVLHERGKGWYIFFSILAGVGAIYIYAEARFTTTLGCAFISAYLIDTNVYILLRKRGLWIARIISDACALLWLTLIIYHIRRVPTFDLTDQLLVRSLTACVCYGILYTYEHAKHKEAEA